MVYPTIANRWSSRLDLSCESVEVYARWTSKILPTKEKWEYAARGSLGGVRRPWSGGWKQAREQKMWVVWREKMCGKIEALQWVVLNQTVMASMIW